MNCSSILFNPVNLTLCLTKPIKKQMLTNEASPLHSDHPITPSSCNPYQAAPPGKTQGSFPRGRLHQPPGLLRTLIPGCCVFLWIRTSNFRVSFQSLPSPPFKPFKLGLEADLTSQMSLFLACKLSREWNKTL